MPTVTVHLDDETYQWYRKQGNKSRAIREAIKEAREVPSDA